MFQWYIRFPDFTEFPFHLGKTPIDYYGHILIFSIYFRPENQRPPVYHDKGTPPKKGGGPSFTVTKLPSSLEPKGQRPLSLPHSP